MKRGLNRLAMPQREQARAEFRMTIQSCRVDGICHDTRHAVTFVTDIVVGKRCCMSKTETFLRGRFSSSERQFQLAAMTMHIHHSLNLPFSEQ